MFEMASSLSHVLLSLFVLYYYWWVFTHCLWSQRHCPCRSLLISRWRQAFSQHYTVWRSLKIFSRALTRWFRRVGWRYSRNSSRGSIHNIFTRSTVMPHYIQGHGVYSPTGLTQLSMSVYEFIQQSIVRLAIWYTGTSTPVTTKAARRVPAGILLYKSMPLRHPLLLWQLHRLLHNCFLLARH